MQFGWNQADMSLFHPTDDRMLSHIGGALSRTAKRNRQRRVIDEDEEEGKLTAAMRRRKRIHHSGSRFIGKHIPRTQARYTRAGRQHRQAQQRQLESAPANQRFQLADNDSFP